VTDREPDSSAGAEDAQFLATALSGAVEGGSPASSDTLVSRPAKPKPDAPLSCGQLVGRYVVVSRLGAGGMGVVYRAFDPDLDRSVALKLVKLDTADVSGDRVRLLREAQAMARLSHPNVIPVFDVGVQDDTVFVAMELVDGVTLTQWRAQTKPDWKAVLDHFVPAGRGLCAAHDKGLIHRDFKPDNVMVGHDGRVRVLDFGLARGSAGEKQDERDATTAELRASAISRISGGGSLEVSMTAAGAVMGTPAYMSPEQHMGLRVTEASDQFSFCVALWEALYGERPFAGKTLGALTANVLQGKLGPTPSGTDVPSWVHDAIVLGLCVDDEKRHASVEALLNALVTDPRARRRKVAVIGGGGAVILGVGSVLGAQVSSERGVAVEQGPSLCTGSDAVLAEIWNDARRDTLQRAFAETNLSYAPAVWTSAAARLDGYAAAWVDGRTEACRATRVTGEQSEALLDRRMLCLQRQGDTLDALLTALAQPDESAVERTIDAVRALPEVSECDDPPTDEDPAKLPADPAARGAIADARATLTAVRAQVAVGHYLRARAILSPVLITAGAVDHPPLSTTALSWWGDIEAASGSPELARQAFEDAFAAATAADDVSAAADLASELAYEYGFRTADKARGEHWLSLGRALVRRGGAEPSAAAGLDSHEGAMRVAAGDYPGALTAHNRALAYWQSVDPDSLSVARVLNDIGAVQVQLGDVEQAIAGHRAALEIKRAAYGDNHPLIATSERELGMALSKMGRHEEARGPLTRSLEINRRARGATHTYVAAGLDDLGRIERHLGDLDTALAYHQEALGIWEKALGDEHPDVAVSLLGIGYTLVAAERHSDAVPIQRRALAMFEATVGAEHPYIIYAANALGAGLAASGDNVGATTVLARSLALRGKVKVDPTLFGDTLWEMGRARWRSATTDKDRREGVALVVEARDLFATQPGRWTKEIAGMDAWLAAPS